MPRPLPLWIALSATLLGGCGRDSGEAADLRTPQPPTLPGVYSGAWPCSNCAAIAATLWLRPDGTFFLRQQFADEETADAPSARSPDATYGLGRWHWDEQRAEAVLRGAGPERRFAIVDDRRIELQVAAPTLHALIRNDDARAFEDRIMLDGESTVTEQGASFRECLTGTTFAIADAGAYRELRRQHRRMNPRGRIALTTVEGRLVTVAEESTTIERLVVDRFITMKPGTGC
jgi:hypothetical protein